MLKLPLINIHNFILSFKSEIKIVEQFPEGILGVVIIRSKYKTYNDASIYLIDFLKVISIASYYIDKVGLIRHCSFNTYGIYVVYTSKDDEYTKKSISINNFYIECHLESYLKLEPNDKKIYKSYIKTLLYFYNLLIKLVEINDVLLDNTINASTRKRLNNVFDKDLYYETKRIKGVIKELENNYTNY